MLTGNCLHPHLASFQRDGSDGTSRCPIGKAGPPGVKVCGMTSRSSTSPRALRFPQGHVHWMCVGDRGVSTFDHGPLFLSKADAGKVRTVKCPVFPDVSEMAIKSRTSCRCRHQSLTHSERGPSKHVTVFKVRSLPYDEVVIPPPCSTDGQTEYFASTYRPVEGAGGLV